MGTNFEQFGWVEERSWWYRREFELPAAWHAAAAIELSLDGLDVCGEVWLNGHPPRLPSFGVLPARARGRAEVCPVRIGQRVTFSRSLLAGRTAREMEPGGRAADE